MDRPKQPGPYPEREFDCARALKSKFEQEVVGSHNTFLDVKRIADVVSPGALEAGWTEDDVRAAVMVLANNKQATDKDIRRVAAAGT